ncbi:MAG: hypothetical protein E6K80_06785 [Candidatus Eisenbacteria bacterium]|uniref:Uncharacterized protein n=1 Tax=Eiseniibacteriota bacterium TaxID=2212470 RepID=A0A538U563_UNCEI|nr:MAG: hypothetical protein E6K80_06785 [Candidatus Eisenbacteria bacterium]
MFWELLFAFLTGGVSLAPMTAHERVASAPVASAPAATVAAPASAEGPADLATPADVGDTPTYSAQRLPFTVRFGETTNDLRVMSMFVLPGETVPVAVLHPGHSYDIRSTQAVTTATAPNSWSWVAPRKPGLYPLEVRERGADRAMTLQVFVMVPFAAAKSGWLNGYHIGTYPAPRSSHYARPAGFVEVTPALENIAVSPHFRLGQFVCKEVGGPPEYLVLRQPLLVKLEDLLTEVNAEGREAQTFHLLSAYRTPSYNAAIGNVTRFSRHHYGDAADIFVDNDGDGRMDDLNRDGRHTVADAQWLGRLASRIHDPALDLTGGLGTYEPTGGHGAFVHVDVRGFEARWGA